MHDVFYRYTFLSQSHHGLLLTLKWSVVLSQHYTLQKHACLQKSLVFGLEFYSKFSPLNDTIVLSMKCLDKETKLANFDHVNSVNNILDKNGHMTSALQNKSADFA
eukprot:UN18336